jgi:phage shock protein C
MTTISDEMAKLDELHERGKLTDDEFKQAKARLLNTGTSMPIDPLLSRVNALRRNQSNRWIAGVCGGLSTALPLDAWVWRLLFVLLTLFGGVGLIVYVLMWVFVPEQ